jgi:hypothetical protein
MEGAEGESGGRREVGVGGGEEGEHYKRITSKNFTFTTTATNPLTNNPD